MRTRTFFLLAGLAAPLALGAYEVSVGTYVCNAWKSLTVPVELDSAAGLSYAGATLTYDPQVLVVTKVEAGSLKSLMAEDFTSAGTDGVVNVAIFASDDVESGSGSIAWITFTAREGAEGQYSDIAVADVSLGEISGVRDVTASNPVSTVNGMVRVMAAGAAVERLESPQTVCAGEAERG